MRVIAGAHGGRRLKAPSGHSTRPTSDRVREALFSSLGDLGGARVLDLFAGSGALGIEALSRGAACAVFVDHDPRAIAVVKANLATLGLGRGTVSVRRQEAKAALRTAREKEESYDLVLIDPPYRDAAALAPVLAEALPAVLAPGARVVCETDRRTLLELPLPLARERRYGDTLLRTYETT